MDYLRRLPPSGPPQTSFVAGDFEPVIEQGSPPIDVARYQSQYPPLTCALV